MLPKIVLVLVLLVVPTVLGRDNGLGMKPMMGWNTWCTQNACFTDWCTSAEVLSVATEIKKLGLLDLGYEYINLDDCWGIRNKTTHKIEGDPTRFPEGMPSFIAKLHGMGFKFGLYTDIGEKACHFPFTGSYPYYQQDADTFKEWEVDYVKFDGCDQPKGFTSANLTGQFAHALNKTGRAMWLNFHCWHTETCAQYGNSYRVGPDHHDNWGSTSGIIKLLQDKREPFWGGNPKYGWPDPDFVFPGGEGCGARSPPGVRCPGQTDDEYISEFSIWAIAGGQIIFATDPRNISSLQRKILFNTEIINVYQDVESFRDVKMVGNGSCGTPHPGPCSVTLTKQISGAKCTEGESFGCTNDGKMWVDKGCRGDFTCDGEQITCSSDNDAHVTCPCALTCQVWARPLSNGDAAIALHNEGSSATDITLDFSDVPMKKWGTQTTCQVRDLWAHKDLSSATGKYTATQVPAHGTAFVTLSKCQ